MVTQEEHSRSFAPLNRWHIGDHAAGDVLRDAVPALKEHDLRGLAADIAFHATLAMLPFLLLLVSLPTVTGNLFAVSDPGQQVADKIGAVFSEEVGSSVSSLLSEVEQSRGWSALSLGILGSLWAGTSTISTIRKALNRIHDCEEDCPLWQKKLTEVGLTIATAAVILGALVAAIMAPSLLGVSGWLSEVMFVGFGLIGAMMVAALLYWLAPAGDSKFRWITPGAGLFVLVWLLFSVGFSVYIANFSNMNNVYGTLGIVAIVILWLYWSSFALLVGAEINAILSRTASKPLDSPLP